MTETATLAAGPRVLCDEGCGRPVHASGKCGSHYAKARLALVTATCSVEDCPDRVLNMKRQLCERHYVRYRKYGDPLLTGRPDLGKTLEERFWEKVDKGDGTGCWVWTEGLSHGYGQIIVMRGKRGHPVRAHRMAWEMLRGPIPDGLDLDHLCHTRDQTCRGGDGCPHRRCVNPAHLEVVTNEVNISRGQWPSAVNARKEFCIRRHEFTPANTYRPPKRPHTRQCKECARMRRAARTASSTEQRAA